MQSESELKLSHKGVPTTIPFEDESYLKCLYQDDPGKVSYSHITISKKECTAKTRSITKRALNNLYLKFHVDTNRVSVRPHILNGEYLYPIYSPKLLDK